jgi:glycosyltransferase involved in cell wall biosynthesis
MNLCLVSQEYPSESGGGGIGKQTRLKAQGLAARGHNVHVVCLARQPAGGTRCDGAVILHGIRPAPMWVPGYEQSSYWLAYSAAVAQRLTELEKTTRFDVIQFAEYGGEGFFYQTDTFANRAARYVVQMHGPLAMFVEHLNWPARGSTFEQIGCFMERTVLHHADAWLASSRWTAAFCAQRYGLELDAIRVVHSAVDTERFRPLDQPAGQGSPRILFVGNLSGTKGVDDLVHVVIGLKRDLPGIRLRLVGKGPRAYVDELRKIIAAGGAQSNIEIAGYLDNDELPAQFAWCDFFAAPAHHEGGPGNVYLEAMSCGRPVIAGNAGGVNEAVLDGQTGLLTPPGDRDALAAAIARLAADEACRRQLGRQARDWILQRFSLAQYIDRIEQVYLGLAQSS